MNVTIAVSTFGDPMWEHLAHQRAVPSAQQQNVPVVHVHGPTLHDARNTAIGQVDTEFVIHLDADDELEPGYVDAMATGIADLRAPSVRYMRGGHPARVCIPRVAGHEHDCAAACLPYGNWLVVGAAVRTDLVREVGGWRDFDWSEDWDLWVRCWQAGASIEAIPTAIYRAHVRSDSRNRAPARAAKLIAHQAIARANGLPVPG